MSTFLQIIFWLIITIQVLLGIIIFSYCEFDIEIFKESYRKRTFIGKITLTLWHLFILPIYLTGSILRFGEWVHKISMKEEYNDY